MSRSVATFGALLGALAVVGGVLAIIQHRQGDIGAAPLTSVGYEVADTQVPNTDARAPSFRTKYGKLPTAFRRVTSSTPNDLPEDILIFFKKWPAEQVSVEETRYDGVPGRGYLVRFELGLPLESSVKGIHHFWRNAGWNLISGAYSATEGLTEVTRGPYGVRIIQNRQGENRQAVRLELLVNNEEGRNL